ncbi:MAG: sugar kinase, partial [Melioribacteraceae bacterium]
MNVLFWGRAVCDLTYLIENFPEENSKIFSTDFIIQPGGTALN